VRVSVTKDVAASPERTFALFTDIAGAPGRVSGILKVEMLTPGPTAVGTRWRETRKMFGKEATEEMWVTALEPGRRIVVEADSCGARMVSTFTFERTAAGTRVTMDLKSTARTFAAKLFTPLGLLFKGMARKLIAKDLDDLARAAEGPPV
jgi:hypothetical protein